MPGNINTFFSTIVSDPAAATDGGNSTTTTSSTRSTMRMSRRTTGNSSWIVSELQQAQQQISQALQTPLDAPPTGAGPDFYMHPRQSMFADLEFLHSRPHATSHATSHAASHHVTSLSETLGANAMSTESEGRHGGERTRRPSDDLIESYLNAEAEGGNIDDASMSFDPSALLRFNVHDLGSNQGASLPLHHALRNAAAIHNSVGMTVQSLRPHGAITGLHNNNIGNVAGGTRTMNPASNTALRNKIVYRLNCAYCCTPVCERAMRAILLADTKIELYSTDIPPRALRTMDDDRLTKGCNCRIRDTVCSGCGNVLGYHVSQPCDRCLDARNNGHFWMFYSEGVIPNERKDAEGAGPLFWTALTPMCEFVPASVIAAPGLAGNSGYEFFCR